VPAELWTRFGQAVGDGNRSGHIRDLIRRFLDGEPMPPLPTSNAAPEETEPVDPPTASRATPFVRPVVRPEFRPSPKPSQKGKR
jgi:hypothetical protein